MTNSKSWYAVYCMPRWEKKVADQLTRKQVTNYCPLNKVKKQWSDRKKMVEEPLFKSYVFVQLTHKEMLTVKQTSGVLNFVYWLGKPAVIRDQEIQAIKGFLNNYTNVELEKSELEVDSRIRIMAGVFMDYEGRVVEINKHTVKVQLPSLGYSLIANVERNSLQAIYMEDEREYKVAR
jgi:transcription antitermination factor NusG